MPESTAIFTVEAARTQRMAQLPEVHSRTVRPTECSPRAQKPDAKSRGTRDNAVRLRHVEPARVPLRHCAEPVEANLRRKRILFAGFVARMEDTRLPKCVMFEEMVGGAGCVGGQKKEWMGCFLDDLRAFGINADQWTTAAQDEGKWHRTAEQGAEHFMGKWIAAEKTKQGWTTAPSRMPEHDGKDQGEDSPKQAGSCSFVRPCLVD